MVGEGQSLWLTALRRRLDNIFIGKIMVDMTTVDLEAT